MTYIRVSKTAEKSLQKVHNNVNDTAHNSDSQELIEFNSEHFKSRLRQLRIDLHLTQKELGDKLGKSNSTIAEWENQAKPTVVPTVDQMFSIARVLKVDVSDLMGVNTSEYSYNGLSWRQEIPKHLNPAMQEQMNLALQVMRYLVLQNMSEEELPDILGGIPLRMIKEYLRYAFRQNILSITDVALRDDLRQRLLHRYANHGLRDAIVVDAGGPIKNNIIRTEMVAFATARYVLDQYGPTVNHVGLGNGYTINRSVSLILPTMKLHQHLKVSPLVIPQETSEVNWDSALLNAIIFQSQMYGAILVAPQQGMTPDIYLAQRELDQYVNRLDLILVTPRIYFDKGNVFHNSRSEMTIDETPLPGNFSEQLITGMHEILTKISKEKTPEVAEILYQPIHKDYFSSSPPSNAAAYSLKNLRSSTASRRHVWLSAAGMDKAQGTAFALNHKLVNGIVIDSEIAKNLLGIP